MAHLDRPYGDWPQAVTSVPADAMRLPPGACRLAVGGPADLVIFRGRRYSELLSRPQHDRVGGWVGGPRGSRNSGRRIVCCLWAFELCVLVELYVWQGRARARGCTSDRPDTPLPRSSRPLPAPQVVVRAGVQLAAAPPPYEELDYVPGAVREGAVPVVDVDFAAGIPSVLTTLGDPLTILGGARAGPGLSPASAARAAKPGAGLGGWSELGAGPALRGLLLAALAAALAVLAAGLRARAAP